MNFRRIPAAPLRSFVEQVFERMGYGRQRAQDATDVLLWASLRGVDTHGVRNLKTYYVDRTLDGTLHRDAQARVEYETETTARMNGGSGLGLTCARLAMDLAIKKAASAGTGIVCLRNAHHLGPAGYFAHMAVEHGMLGLCATGHFFGKGHRIGVAPFGTLLPMFSTNPLSFAAPCGRHAPFLLDMATSAVTVNRIEMHGQEGRAIPIGWARDERGEPTADAANARLLSPLGGTTDVGGHKGIGLGLMVSVLTGVLSGAWATIANQSPASSESRIEFDQPTMGHAFAAVRVDALLPLESFRAAMDAMIDALHASSTNAAQHRVCYPGEIEAATALERLEQGIPVSDYLFAELAALGQKLDVQFVGA